MMIDITRPGAASTPSPLLQALAGEAAESLARIWRAPHAPFLLAPAPWRHLLGIALATGVPLKAAMANAVLATPLRDAITLLLPDAPPGIKRALGRMGETGWPAVSYRRLLDFMRRPETAKPLRHAAALDPAALERIAALPAGLIETGLARPDLTPAGLAILQECFEALAERDGLDRAAALAQPWSKAKSVRALFNRVKDELLADFPPLPFAATPRLRWLTCKSEMLEAAQRYRNCLSRYLNDASAGHRVFGEWLEGPGATFEVGRDEVFGWRLTQARGMGNSHLSDTAYEALGVDLRGLGIRVGHSGGALRRVAGYAAYGWDLRGQFYDQAVVFGDDGYQHPLEDIDLDI